MKAICIKSLSRAGSLTHYRVLLTKDQVYDIQGIEYYDDDSSDKKFVYYLKDNNGTEVFCEKNSLKRSTILFEEYFQDIREYKIDLLIN